MPKIAFNVSMLAIALTVLWGLATVVVVIVTVIDRRRALNHWRRHLRPEDKVSVKIDGKWQDGEVIIATNYDVLMVTFPESSIGRYNLKVKSKECYYPISK